MTDSNFPRTLASAAPRRPALAPVLRTAGVLLAAAIAAACGGAPETLRASVPPEAVDDAPWEARYDPSELTGFVEGKVCRPIFGAEPGGKEYDACDGARVVLLLPRPDGRGPLVPVSETRSAADGSYRLEKAPPGPFAVRTYVEGAAEVLGGSGLRIPGFLPIVSSPDQLIGGMPARTVSGRVVDAAGAPVPGVCVELTSLGFLDHCTTAADGSFSFRTTRAQLSLTVLDPAWDTAVQGVGDDQSGADATGVEIHTARADVLAGRVATAEDGRPIEGAVVMSLDVESNGDPAAARTRTDADGRFRLPVPRRGRIAAFAAGRGWKSYDLLRTGEQEILLHAVEGVRGRVVDADGRPVAGARLVGLGRTRSGLMERILGPLSGADGSFDFSWMPPARRGAKRPAAILAWHRLRGSSAAVTLPLAAPGPVTLTLGGARDVTGVVVDHAGRPVRGVAVAAEWTRPPLDAEETSVLPCPSRAESLSDREGAFRLVAVPADRDLVVRASIWGLELSHEIGPGAAPVSHRFVLPAGRPLAGRVTDVHGAAPGAPGVVRIRLLDTPGVDLDRTVPTGPDGGFRFDDLPPGRYSLRADVESYALPGGGTAEPGADDVRLTVERPSAISARVTFEGVEGPPPSVPLDVILDNLDNPSLPAKRTRVEAGAAPGTIPVGNSASGNRRVRIEGDVWRGRADVRIAGDGAPVTLDIPLVRTERFRAVLRGADGAPLSGVAYILRPAGGGESSILKGYSEDGGVVKLAGLSPGRWEFRATPPFHAPLVHAFDAPLSDPLDLRAPPSGTIEVVVLGRDGAPAAADTIVSLADAAGAAAFAWGDDGGQLRSRFRTGAGGRVRLLGVPVGRYRVEAVAPGAKPVAADAEVGSGRTVQVEIRGAVPR